MASNPVFAAFSATEEIPILHYYGVEVYTMAKRILISALLLKGNKVDVEEFLKDTFPRKQQIILSPYYGGSSFSLNDISFQELEDIAIFKPSNEPQAIIGQHNEDEYNTHRIAYVNAAPDEKSTSLDLLRDFLHNAVLENLSASIHKEFASYHHPNENQRLLLLGNRKVYTTDKNKIHKFELARKKEDSMKKKSEARANLPSTSTKLSANPPPIINSFAESNASKTGTSNFPASKASASNVSKSEPEGKRRARKEINYKEDSGNTTSSVEYPVEGKHTDEESGEEISDQGSRTPLFVSQSQEFPAFMTEPAATMQTTGGPLNFHTRIPKSKKKSAKHSRRSLSPEDSKPSSTREKKRLEKKSSKRTKKHSRKTSRRARKYSSNEHIHNLLNIHNLLLLLLLPISPGNLKSLVKLYNWDGSQKPLSYLR